MHKRLNAAHARSLLPHFVAIGIDALDADGKLTTVWVESRTRTQVALSHIDFSDGTPASINASETDRVFFKTEQGDVFFVDLYEVSCGEFGYALGDNMYWRCDREFASALSEAFALASYSSKERHHTLAQIVFRSGRFNTPPNQSNETEPGTGDGAARVIFYAPDHNRQFAQTVQAADRDHVVISELGADSSPAVLAGRLVAIKAHRNIAQIIFACHGAPAMFQGGPLGAPVDSPTSIGLYQHDTQPEAFGASILNVIDPRGTITLLSCSTAALNAHPALDGKLVLSKLAKAANAHVIGCDDTVFIQAEIGRAYTGGNIYACPPQGPVGVWLPAQHNQTIPLDPLPALAAAA